MIAEKNAKEFPDALLRTGNGVKMFMWAGMTCFLQIERKRRMDSACIKSMDAREKFGRKRTKGKRYEANRRKYGYVK